MRLADPIWLVFSLSGFAAVTIALAIWLLISPRSKRAPLVFLVVALGYATISIYPLSHWAAGLLARPYKALAHGDVPPGRTAVVLLGSGSFTIRDWSGNRVSLPDLTGIERALEAARVFTLTNAEWIVSSGGRVDPADPDEPSALSMTSLLVWMGIPKERIVLERDSRDTHDEAVLVKELLPSLGVDHVVLVTSPIHMRRSLAVFRRSGIDAIPAVAFERSAADHWTRRYLPSEDGLREAAVVVHELLGLVYYKVRGWL